MVVGDIIQLYVDLTRRRRHTIQQVDSHCTIIIAEVILLILRPTES